MNTRNVSTVLVCTLLLALAAAPSASAQVAAFVLNNPSLIAVGPPNPGPNINGGISTGNDAFVFTVGSSNISVTSLGIFSTTAGLVDSHAVGIFANGSNSAIVQAVVPASGPIVSNGFQYTSITPTTLLANTTYVLADVYTGYNDAQNWGGVTVNPAINFSMYYYDHNLTLGNAALAPAGDGIFWNNSTAYIGSNFQFTVIPEPSTYAALLGLTSFGFVTLRRRARRVAA